MNINHATALTKINRMSKQYSTGNDFSVSALPIVDIIKAFVPSKVRMIQILTFQLPNMQEVMVCRK
jgi:hypothetical protein